jgi:type IV secretion system protein TrbG
MITIHRSILAVLTILFLFTQSSKASEEEPADKFFTEENPALTEQEEKALAIAKEWEAGISNNMTPATGPNGSVKFVYGAQHPQIVCAVLQVCDVALQAGEQVNSIQLGDTARWMVEPAISGSGPTETVHLIIKPTDVGLSTSLVVTTNRRAYHLRLRSHRSEYIPQASFIYPEEALAKWEAVRLQQKQKQEQNTLSTGEYLGDLSFDYEVEGSTSFTPVRTYNDGQKTVIEMPHEMKHTEAPTLVVVKNDGGWFSDDETTMINYRVQGNRYIVDTVFDKAMLVVGVGSNQERVTISRRQL